MAVPVVEWEVFSETGLGVARGVGRGVARGVGRGVGAGVAEGAGVAWISRISHWKAGDHPEVGVGLVGGSVASATAVKSAWGSGEGT